MKRNPATCVSISGGACTGKTTLASTLAQDLGMRWIDRGSYFRAVTYHLNELHLFGSLNERLLLAAIEDVQLSISGVVVLINGRDISSEIRLPVIEQMTPRLKHYPKVLSLIMHKLDTYIVGDGTSVVVTGRSEYRKAQFRFFLDPNSDARHRWLINSGRLSEGQSSVSSIEHYLSSRDIADQVPLPSPSCVVITVDSLDERVDLIKSYVLKC